MKQGIKILIFSTLAFSMFYSCQENLEKRAQREAKEYTEQCCPTPVVNFSRTDSVVFDIPTKTYIYYCSLSDKLDDKAIVAQHYKELHDNLLQSIKDNTGIRKYKEAGFNFSYVVHSTKNPQQVLFNVTFTQKEYGNSKK